MELQNIMLVLAERDTGYLRHEPTVWKCGKGCIRTVPSEYDRFVSLIDIRNNFHECWNWTGNLNDRDYATWGLKRLHTTRANRHSYLLWNGEIPEGMEVRHMCHNRKCVNPAHLILGSHYENMQDMVNAKRSCKGSDTYCAKLTESDIPVIRRRLANGDSQRAIARDYGMDHKQIGAIHHNKAWTHVK